MDPASILTAISLGSQILTSAASAYASIKATLSETDQAKIEAALDAANVQYDADFTRVDAELDAAGKTAGA